MELTFVWMPLALGGILATAIAVFVVLRRARRAGDKDVVAAAHADRLLKLPAYKRAFIRAIAGFALLLVSLGVTLTALTVVAARPVAADVNDSDIANRDIVLCLDVSGSMSSIDGKVLEYFSALAERFHGERIALVVWDATPVTIFPLTDDYPFITKTLEDLQSTVSFDLAQSPDSDVPPLTAGTDGTADSSLIGDGLASCVQRFDNADKERSRTIVLATDNELAGTPLLSLTDATDLAVDADVRVYGLAPYGTSSTQQMDQELQRTDGQVFDLGDFGGADQIINAVLSDQAATLDGVPQLAITDAPGGWLVLGIFGLWGIGFAVWMVRT